VFASAVVNAVSLRLHTLLIGRIYSGGELGLYSRAVTTRDATQAMLTTVFSRVAFPVLARHGGDAAALRTRLKAGNQLVMAISLPSMLGLSLVADLAIPTLFGPQWLGTAPVLRVLCLAGAIWPLQVSNVQLMMAQGRSGTMLAMGLLKAAILAVSMLVASRWGILAIAWATVFSALVSLLLNTACSRKLIGYGILAQVRDLGAYILLTLCMLLVVAASAHAISWLSPGKRLLAEVAIGAVFYLGMASLLRLPVMSFAMEVLASLRTRGKDVAAPRTRHAGG
jgi:O-antigen/teichoic acid export membrane protein